MQGQEAGLDAMLQAALLDQPAGQGRVLPVRHHPAHDVAAVAEWSLPIRLWALAQGDNGEDDPAVRRAMLFFQLINRRYERASTVLTSNKGFEEWGQILGDEVMAAALKQLE